VSDVPVSDGPKIDGPPPGPPPLEAGQAMIRVATTLGGRVLGLRAQTGFGALQLQVVRLCLTGSSMNGLAETLSAPKSTITSVVDLAVEAGLVERVTDSVDRRRQIVTSTPLGVALIEKFDADLSIQVRHMLSGLPTEQRERLTDLFAKFPDPVKPIPLS
jgi:DNA-binding MarR family transcriptional regulator